ncbi:YhfC family glutamic-type intramembrane protease [Thermococcus sp. GR6]|uniref:YhfC family glutamic-type intramembrane protease n=1 Tax=Thermococcus sp. GR6 TaxID=1638256 RepID=UPI001430A66D|nr:YhfC family glutamic-type intramembrane protease [Thermococcus sp. GR6]NJE42831.1 YhfC family intramembrane metalloprotease [Thermococcus sp. GR6]
MYLLPFPIMGGLFAWATIYFLGFKRTKWSEFVFGLAIFFIAIIVQNPIQQLPLLALGIHSNADVIAKGAAFTIAASLWLGFVAGLVQEGTKYLLVKGKNLRTALFVGLGFGVTEAFFVGIIAAVAAIASETPLDVPVSTALFSLVERYFAVLFHVGTTVFLAHAYREGFGKKGLIAIVGLHTVVDSMAAYYQLRGSETFMYATEAIFAVIALALMYYIIPRVKVEKPEEEKVIW